MSEPRTPSNLRCSYFWNCTSMRPTVSFGGAEGPPLLAMPPERTYIKSTPLTPSSRLSTWRTRPSCASGERLPRALT